MFSLPLKPLHISIISAQDALVGRETVLSPGEDHLIFEESFSSYDPNHTPPRGVERIILGLGCFWGAERLFWCQEGVVFTSVGYAGGHTPNPSYEEVCSGQTGHCEVVQVDFNPDVISLSSLLKLFWESHDPTQGMRQGNDIGTQYRSVIYWTHDSQKSTIEASKRAFEGALQSTVAHQALGHEITTELAPLSRYYYAEPYHQQYLHRNPNGYCGLKGTGVTCAIL